jgi:hypothetical protein
MTEELNAREIRKNIKKKYGKFYDLVEQVLFLTDIMDLNTVQNDFYDEYEPEVDKILPLLESAKSADDVLNIVLSVFAEMFNGVNLMYSQKSYASVREEYEDLPEEFAGKFDIASKLIWRLSQKFPLDEKCVRIS